MAKQAPRRSVSSREGVDPRPSFVNVSCREDFLPALDRTPMRAAGGLP
jgi:hypothetical protein